MKYKKILIIRTDRIGDVILSTPVIAAIKKANLNAHVAMMVRPYAEDIINGNPYIDEVITYDKYGRHKRILETIKFAFKLRREKFDLALILHPTNRVNWIAFLAGIPHRVGYGKKCGFLLTKRLRDTRCRGEKHESEYAMDVARAAGIDGDTSKVFIPERKDAKQMIVKFLNFVEVVDADRLIGIHPGASCPSKKWPAERFAQVADKLIEAFNCKAIIIYGPGEIELARAVEKNMQKRAILSGKEFSIAELTSLIKRCSLLVTNDNGPMHIAAAIGTPVVAVFGRSQAGLSPARWAPLGAKSRCLHKPVGCKLCRAHECKNEFKCLLNISVDEVFDAAVQSLSL